MEKKQVLLEIREIGDNGTFEGLLSAYDVVDEYNDIVERGAYTQTLKSNNYRVPLLWQHDQAMPIGELTLTDGAEGLEAKGRILLDDAVPEARKAYALLKAGLVRGLSIGFKTIRSITDGKLRRLKEIRLFEGSLVTIPANRFALVTQVKALQTDSKDFMAELAMIQAADAHEQMMEALKCSLWKVAMDPMLSIDQKTEAVAASIDQFRAAYIEQLPAIAQAVAMMGGETEGESETSAFAVAMSRRNAPAVRDFCTKFLELEGKHPGTSRADAAGAAPNGSSETTDSDAFRSWLQEQFGS